MERQEVKQKKFNSLIWRRTLSVPLDGFGFGLVDVRKKLFSSSLLVYLQVAY